MDVRERERATSPRPALRPSRWSPACALFVSWPFFVALPLTRRARQMKPGRAHNHASTPASLFTSGNISSSEHSCSQRSWGIVGAASPLQPLRSWISGTDGWINRKSMGLHGVRMQGYFPNYGKRCSWAVAHISPLLSHLTFNAKPLMSPGLGWGSIAFCWI